jgi:chromosome segregation ATPase
MKYLTFLDYSLLEASGKSIDAELQVKDKQIQSLASQMQSRSQEIEMLKQELKSWEEVAEKMKVYVDKRKKEEERQRRLYTEIDKHYPGWREKFHARLGRPGDEIVDELMAVMQL